MNILKCNLCGSSKQKKIFDAESHGKTYQICKCVRCDLVFMNPLPSRKELDLYYSNSYNYQNFLSNEVALRNRAKTHLSHLQKFAKKGRLLEIGCMYGFFMKEAQNRGFEVYGIEKSIIAADYGRKNLRLNIESSDLADTNFEKEFFDVVFMSHVIEHLINPLDELKKINSFLKPGGILVLRCPNFSSLSARIMKQYWSWLCPPEHIFQFSPKTLSAMLNAAGFKVKSISSAGGDNQYLRYLGVEFFNYLPVKNFKKIQYRARIDNEPNHWSQVFLLRAYKCFYPLIKIIHKMNLGQELIVVGIK